MNTQFWNAKSSKSFTLIEMIMAIVVLGIIGSLTLNIVLDTYQTYVMQKRLISLKTKTTAVNHQILTYLNRSIKSSIASYTFTYKSSSSSNLCGANNNNTPKDMITAYQETRFGAAITGSFLNCSYRADTTNAKMNYISFRDIQSKHTGPGPAEYNITGDGNLSARASLLVASKRSTNDGKHIYLPYIAMTWIDVDKESQRGLYVGNKDNSFEAYSTSKGYTTKAELRRTMSGKTFGKDKHQKLEDNYAWLNPQNYPAYSGLVNLENNRTENLTFSNQVAVYDSNLSFLPQILSALTGFAEADVFDANITVMHFLGAHIDDLAFLDANFYAAFSNEQYPFRIYQKSALNDVSPYDPRDPQASSFRINPTLFVLNSINANEQNISLKMPLDGLTKPKKFSEYFILSNTAYGLILEPNYYDCTGKLFSSAECKREFDQDYNLSLVSFRPWKGETPYSFRMDPAKTLPGAFGGTQRYRGASKYLLADKVKSFLFWNLANSLRFELCVFEDFGSSERQVNAAGTDYDNRLHYCQEGVVL